MSSNLMGSLDISRHGNRFILAFQDYFTEWVQIIPFKNATAHKVSQYFERLNLLRYGAQVIYLNYRHYKI